MTNDKTDANCSFSWKVPDYFTNAIVYFSSKNVNNIKKKYLVLRSVRATVKPSSTGPMDTKSGNRSTKLDKDMDLI